MRTDLVLSVLVVTAALAGCLGGESDEPDGTGETGPTLPRLADFTDCDFTYPDNATEIPCENLFTRLEITPMDAPPSLTDGWLCIHDGSLADPMNSHYILWDPVTDMLGIYYWVDSSPHPVHGYLVAQGAKPVYWEGGGLTGFIELYEHPGDVTTTPWPRNVVYEVRLYNHDFNTTTPALESATLDTLWSLYGDVPYPVQRLTTGNETYYFDEVRRTPWGEGEQYDVGSFALAGEDFDLTVTSNRLMNQPGQVNNLPSNCAI